MASWNHDLISVQPDLRAFNKWCAKVLEKQTPYAMSRAINQVAKESVAEVRARLPDHFKLRSGFVARGIRWRPTNKRDKPFIRGVEVGTVDRFMILQQEGGTKRPEGKHRLAIPAFWLAQKRGVRGVPKPLRPSRLLASGRAFLDKGSLQRGEREGDDILLRAKGGPPRIAFFLRPTAKIRPRWPFFKQVEDVVRREYPKAFNKWMTNALETAKP